MDLRFFLSNFAFLSLPVVLGLKSLVNIPFLKPKVFKTDQCYDLLWHRGRSDFSFLYSMLWLYRVLWCFSSWKWNCSTSRETAACQYFCSLSLSSSPDLDQSRVIFFCVCLFSSVLLWSSVKLSIGYVVAVHFFFAKLAVEECQECRWPWISVVPV